MQTEILAATAYRYSTLSGGCGVIAVFIGNIPKFVRKQKVTEQWIEKKKNKENSIIFNKNSARKT